MNVPDLIYCSDEEECDIIDECYQTVNSYASSVSIRTLNDENDNNHEINNEYELQNYNKRINSIGSKLNGIIALLDFQASNLADQREVVTTKWNFEFDPTSKRFRFLVTEIMESERRGFEFITLSIKMPRNEPKKWYHYVTDSTYHQIIASSYFNGLSDLQQLSANTVARDQNIILKEVWYLDGVETEGKIHTLDSILQKTALGKGSLGVVSELFNV